MCFRAWSRIAASLTLGTLALLVLAAGATLAGDDSEWFDLATLGRWMVALGIVGVLGAIAGWYRPRLVGLLVLLPSTIALWIPDSVGVRAIVAAVVVAGLLFVVAGARGMFDHLVAILAATTVVVALGAAFFDARSVERPELEPETRSEVRYAGLRHVGPWGTFVDDLVTSTGDVVLATGSQTFRSADGGATWTPVRPDDEPGTFDVLAADPLDRTVLFAVRSDGSLLRGADAGATWSKVGDDAPGSLLALAVGPAGVLYAGGWDGLFRSTSSGRTWQRVGADDWWISSIAVDPTDRRIAHAGGGPGVVRTVDGFESWDVRDVDEEYEDRQVDTIVVDPDSPRTLVAVDVGSLNRSEDGGATWSRVDPQGFPGGRWREHRLAADPRRPQVLYLVASNTHDDVATGGTVQGDEAWLLRSIDFGQRWSIVARARHDDWLWAHFNSLAVDPSNGRVYVGDDNGVLVCTACAEIAARGS